MRSNSNLNINICMHSLLISLLPKRIHHTTYLFDDKIKHLLYPMIVIVVSDGIIEMCSFLFSLIDYAYTIFSSIAVIITLYDLGLIFYSCKFFFFFFFRSLHLCLTCWFNPHHHYKCIRDILAHITWLLI
jgi:hypothetical protein